MRGPTRFGPGELVGPLLIVMLTGAVIATFIIAILLTRGGVGGEAVVVSPPTPTPAGTPGTPPPGGGATVEIAMIPTILFDTDTLTIAAGEAVTLTADNIDPGVPHNWAVYTSREAAEAGEGAIAATRICTDCTETITFEPPPPGEYFFRCDVHPIQMVGTLIVQ